MIYITGDTHNEQSRMEYIFANSGIEWAFGDFLIVLGDFGYVNRESTTATAFLDYMETLSASILFIDGNHDNYPLIYSYPEELWNGGKIHRIRSNVFHLARGQCFSIDGKTFFAMGGGFSSDKIYRQEGISWWPQEMPLPEEYAEATENLKANNFKVDYILTHAAPIDTVRRLEQNVYADVLPLNNWLEYVREMTEYKHWFFGHHHCDRYDLWRGQTALYYNIVAIGESGIERYVET